MHVEELEVSQKRVYSNGKHTHFQVKSKEKQSVNAGFEVLSMDNGASEKPFVT